MKTSIEARILVVAFYISLTDRRRGVDCSPRSVGLLESMF